jgi:hypothetical protein
MPAKSTASSLGQQTKVQKQQAEPETPVDLS